MRSIKLDSDKIIVVPNWQDEESFIDHKRQANQFEENPFTFMYLGNIGPVAGMDLLVKAFASAKLKTRGLLLPLRAR